MRVGAIYWTDYPFVELGDVSGQPAPRREVELVDYDGNKYARVRFPDGQIAKVKAGYLHETLDQLMEAQR